PASVPAQSFKVHGASASASVGDAFSVGATSFDIARQLGFDTQTSLGTGDLFTVTLSGITAHAGGDNAQIDLGGDGLNIYSFTKSGFSAVFVSGTGLTLTATLGPVSATATVRFTYNPSTVTDWSFAGGPASVDPQYFNVHGGIATISVGSGFSIGVTSFDIARRLGFDTPTSLGIGDLFTLTLGGIPVHAGGANAQLDLSGTTLSLSSFTKPGTSAAYVSATGLTLIANLGPVSVGGTVDFTYNPSTVTDWSFA